MGVLWRSSSAAHPPAHIPHAVCMSCQQYKTPRAVLRSYPSLMSDPKVAIFWDYENCSPPSSSAGLGYDIVNNIARMARLFGPVTSFRAYLDISAQSPKSVVLRSELQSSGVSIIDCPHNGKKDVVDKMILVDMLAFALDHPSPATVFLITGDRDYAYAVSILKLRKYQVILVVPSSPNTSPSLENQASLVIDWATAVLRTRAETANPVRQPYLDLDATIVTKLLRDLQEFPLDDPDTTQGPSKWRRVTTQDLLEPSRHSKNTESFDATREFTRNPASPKKSTIPGSDSAPGGLPIPKTPSRSRHASVSTGSTRARSTTIVAQPPPVQDAPSKSPPPSTARRPSTPDIKDIPNLSHRSPSVLTSLDALELPLHDDRPPSSIIVRSPLVTSQSTYDIPGVSGKHSIPSSHKLNSLASPFVMTSAPLGLQSVLNQQSHTAVEPTSPFMVPTKTVCRTPQMNPKETEQKSESISHRVPSEGADLAKSNDYSYVASHTTHSLPSRNVGLHFTNTISSKHVSHPAAGFLDVGDGVDAAQFAAFPYASHMQDSSTPGFVSASSSVSPSIPSTTESHQHDESDRCQTWTMFRPLIHLLLAARERGFVRPSRSVIALDLVKMDKQVYQRAGVSRFKDYTALAEQAGIIELGGIAGDAWIALHPDWFGMNEMTTTRFISNRVPSPTFDPSKATQIPLLTGPEMIETAAIIQALGPRSRSSSDTSPTSPINRQDSAYGDAIPAQFRPLIDGLARMRTEGSHQPRRSVVGQMLDPIVYTLAGVSGFKEYILRASELQLVEFGGVGGFAWISLHPELRF